MSKQSKSHIVASVGTSVFLLLCFLLLWLIYIDVPQIEEDEGIMVSFGNVEEAGGMQAEPVASAPTVTTAPPPTPAAPSDNDLITQEDEEALALAKQREDENKRKATEEAERLRKQKEIEAAAEAERIAKEKALAEQRAKEQQAIENANKLGSLFGNSTTSNTGNGDQTGSGAKGNPVGKGISDGAAWSLNGRNLRGTLAKPQVAGVQEGTVIVEIRVNTAGKVISAVAKGGTISETATRRAACDAAYKATFSEGKGEVFGTITYTFKNN